MKKLSLKELKSKFKKIYFDEFDDPNESFMDFMLDLIPKNSLRSLSQSSGGMLPVNVSKALLELANGHFGKALVELIFRG